MVNIALIGYGRMGQTVHALAEQKGIAVTAIVDPNVPECLPEIEADALREADVCIDFTEPDAVVENVHKLASLGKNAVVATTGWYDRMDEVQQSVAEHEIGLIWSGNFSIGVHAFFRIVAYAAQRFNQLPDYDVMAHEFHHRHKADSPSGTARMLGDLLLAALDRKETLVTEELKRKITPEELHFSSTRGGSVPGTHLVLFDSSVDTIELRHTARGREGFAVGALTAAEFIHGKTGFYSVEDLMADLGL
jgi:4-hydroxy-tetrahydrodipicolinate reductase